MKKILLSGAAALALAFAATPAQAGEGNIDLELGGFFKGYVLYVDHDSDFGGAVGAGAGDNRRELDIRRSMMVTFSGETTLDNGLTVGAVAEMEMEDNNNNEGTNINHPNFDGAFEESYIYFQGGWGRVNFGNEDGAGYLLQVAAPSADDNIDGVRQNISGFQLGGGAAETADRMDYDMDNTWGDEKITYLTPNWQGFQAGISWTPEVQKADGVNTAVAGMDLDNELGDWENAFEIAARFDGEFEGFDFALGGGYNHASEEMGVAGTTDDWEQWNIGLDIGFQAFGLGAAYFRDNNSLANNGDTTVWVVGVDWENGPYTLGLSYMDREDEVASTVGTAFGAETDHTRVTGGGSYTYGPGMTFRGSVSWVEQDVQGTTQNEDAWQIGVGTDITF